MAAAVKLTLYHSRRHSLHSLHSYPRFPLFHRHLSSDSNSKPSSPPPSIQPVSYPVRPQSQQNDQSPPPPSPTQQQLQQQKRKQQQQFASPPRGFPNPPPQETRSNWSREDIRYMKDAQSVSIVSYPSRVAPLPEDSSGGRNAEMDKESRSIEAENREKKRLFRVFEEEEKEKVVLPFPRLIKPVRKDKKPLFDLRDALREIKANARPTFDETLEAHVRLGIDKSRSDMIVRGMFSLPHGGAKALRVAVFADGTDAEEARAAGADVVGGVEFVQKITGADKIDFDHCLTTTQFMTALQSGPLLLKLAKVLRRHGLRLDSKEGTVVGDVARSVKDAKSQIKFKMDKGSIVHTGLGKVSLSEASLRENIGAFMNALLEAKPAGLKKTSKYAGYVNSFHICSTMGPGFPVSVQSVSKAVDQYNKVQLK